MIKREWFRDYEAHQKPQRLDRIVQSGNTASKPTDLSDYSVCKTWGVSSKDIYLLQVFRKRLNFPDPKRAVCDQLKLFKPDCILIEDKGSGTSLIQQLKDEGLTGVTVYEPERDKIIRMDNQTAVIENGFVYLPREAPWRADYLHELTIFPKGRHDDQVDSTS